MLHELRALPSGLVLDGELAAWKGHASPSSGSGALPHAGATTTERHWPAGGSVEHEFVPKVRA